MDAKLIFYTRLDNSKLEKDLKKAETKIEKATERIARAHRKRTPLMIDAQELERELKSAEAKLRRYQKRFTELQSVTLNAGTDRKSEGYKSAVAEIPQVRDSISNQESFIENLKKQLEGVNKQAAKYDLEIKEATQDLEENTKQAEALKEELSSAPAKMRKAYDEAEQKVKKLNTTILRVGASMLMYKAFSAIMQGVSEYMSKVLKTNAEYTAQLAQLKGALLTAFQPIYEAALPALMMILKILTAIASVVGNVLSGLFGSNIDQSAQNAKALNTEAEAIENVGDAAAKARKQIMGFDEINKLESVNAGTGGVAGGVGGIKPDFSAFDTAQYRAKIDELTVYLSGALLALGAILAFSGANIPLGIGLMAAGAIGLAVVAKENWNEMPAELKKAFGDVTAIVSSSLLAIGAILAFSGVNIPLGIALIAVGAAGLVAATAMNWDSISKTLRTETGEIVAYLSTMALVIGAILAFSGINIPLGIALMVAGLSGTVATGAANWDLLKSKMISLGDWLKGWLSDVIDYLNRTFENGIINGLSKMIEDAVTWIVERIADLFRWIGENWNQLWNTIGNFFSNNTFAGGELLPAYPQVSYQSIPALAQGAVIPPNRQFLAVLGDQTHGTNIEAPLDTIKQAVAEVLAGQGNGETAALLRELIAVVESIEVGDEVIGKAAARYTRKTARARGT